MLYIVGRFEDIDCNQLSKVFVTFLNFYVILAIIE